LNATTKFAYAFVVRTGESAVEELIEEFHADYLNQAANANEGVNFLAVDNAIHFHQESSVHFGCGVTLFHFG
jgi:hypothetical protein